MVLVILHYSDKPIEDSKIEKLERYLADNNLTLAGYDYETERRYNLVLQKNELYRENIEFILSKLNPEEMIIIDETEVNGKKKRSKSKKSKKVLNIDL